MLDRLPPLTMDMFPGEYPMDEHDLYIPCQKACLRMSELMAGMSYGQALAVLDFMRSLVLLQKAQDVRDGSYEEGDSGPSLVFRQEWPKRVEKKHGSLVDALEASGADAHLEATFDLRVKPDAESLSVEVPRNGDAGSVVVGELQHGVSLEAETALDVVHQEPAIADAASQESAEGPRLVAKGDL